jgi:hypothetical protein
MRPWHGLCGEVLRKSGAPASKKIFEKDLLKKPLEREPKP